MAAELVYIAGLWRRLNGTEGTAMKRAAYGRNTLNWSVAALIVAALLGPLHAWGRSLDSKPVDRQGEWSARVSESKLARVIDLIEESNAPHLIGRVKWQSLLAARRKSIAASPSHKVFTRRLNELFEATGQSHFQYYSDDDWSFWHIASTFGSRGPDTVVEHAGLYTENIASRWFVRGVLEGSVADGCGVLVGDEVVSADGEPFEPITSFRGKAGQTVKLRLRRRADDEYTVDLTPVRESLHRAIQRAIRKSINILEYEGLHFVYVHAWSFMGSGTEYQTLLDLQDEVDGLLWDLRDGCGGIAGRGKRFLLGGRSSGARWHKPAVLLIDDGTRSAKEILVNQVKKADRAALVGMPTPGHVTSVGGFRRVGSDGLLMLPGERFRQEGHPVTPHVRIDRPVPYSAGEDPQLDMGKLVPATVIADYSTLPATTR